MESTPEPTPSDATIKGYYYDPPSMVGSTRMVAQSWEDCRQLCFNHYLCVHFGYWPDGGCMLQDGNVSLVKAVCGDSELDCAGLRVISGPRDLADRTLWPSVVMSTSQAVSTLAPSEIAIGEAKPSDSGANSGTRGRQWTALLFGIPIVGGATCAAVAYYLSMGRSGDESSESDIDTEGLEMPLTREEVP